jgi:RNA 2',3'-cyclic 3'-phosphodiesterase
VRLFVAIEIPSDVRDRIMALINELRAAEPPSPKRRAKWVRAENLHITLKFIGHVETVKLDAIREVLSKVRSDTPVDASFRAIGFFPGEKRPRVLWVGIKGSPSLALLAKQIDQLLEPLGIAPEKREFAPHLTLARFDPPGISEPLRVVAQKHTEAEFGSVHTNEFHLIESKLKHSGAEYITLHSFRFAANRDL